MEISNEAAIWAVTTAGAIVAILLFRMDRKLGRLSKAIGYLDQKVEDLEENIIFESNRMEQHLSARISGIAEWSQQMDQDTIDIDRRLIVLETIRSEQRPRTDVTFSNTTAVPSSEYVPRRRARRASKA